MSMPNTAENNLMKLLFNNTTWAGIGDATGIVGSATAGSWFISGFTADPGEAGDQTTNEISYTGYTRPPVARSGAGWAVTNNSVSPVSTISFAASTGGTGGTMTHWGVGKSSSGAGELVVSGTIAPNIPVSSGVTPQLTTASTLTVD
jgi:hypothetical protein